MFDYEIQKLDESNRHLLNDFSCVETEEMLKTYNSKVKKRIIKHSKEMNDFLHNEAWDDQEKGLSTTYLFLYENKVVAYLSLCNDAIQLELKEREGMELSYTTEPAIKVARLAVSNEYQGHGLGKDALEFSVVISQYVREYSGVVFITLDCYEHRVSYYTKFGFVRNLIQPIEIPYDSPISMRLWIDDYLEKTAYDIL